MTKFWEHYPEINSELEDIKKIIKDNTKEKVINEPLSPVVESGGKMLRPAFLLMAGKFGEYKADRLKNLGAIMEMLHTATLIHDDIIDDSHLRRGQISIQSKYGKDFAVYMGDYLFCKCFMMLSKDFNMEDMGRISKVISKICLGEMRQHYARRSTKVSLKEYLKIISGKTAALFSLSFYIGARESNCDERLCKLLGKIGYDIGMAFQIIDDILDYSGSAETVGKDTRNDLKQGYYTLPLIYEFKNNNKLLKLLKNKELEDKDIDRIYEEVRSSQGIEKSRKLAKRYTNRAFDRIDKLPDNNNKVVLKEILDKLLNREY